MSGARSPYPGDTRADGHHAFFADETPLQIAAAIANQEAITGWTVRALVHTYDPEVADTPEFVAEIDRATAVWFGGVRRNAQVL